MRRCGALLLALACAHRAPPADPRPAAPSDPLPAIRAEAEALLEAQGEAWWTSWTTGASLDATATYRGKDRILSPASLDQVKAALSRASGDDRRALVHLRAYLAGERIAQAIAQAADRLATAEARAAVTWEAKEVPLRRLDSLLVQEPVPERRAALENARAAAVARLAPLAAASAAALREAAKGLGYPSALALAADLRGEAVESLTALAEAVLGATDDTYRAVMEGLSRSELELPLASTRARDLPRLFHTAHEPRAFPAGRLAETADATLAALGLDRSKIEGLLLDLEPRPGKSPRPLAVPVRVPGAVRLSALQLGGAAETRAFLQELGAALYYACDRAKTMEFRRLGPSYAAGTWSRLFAGLAGDPAWLAERTGLQDHALRREIRAALAEELHEARMLAARLLLEVESARDPASGAEIRIGLLSRALSRPVDREEASRIRLDPDPLLQSAEALRALLLSAQIEGFLARKAGGPWWRSKESGEWLVRTWAEGSRPTAEELALAAGEKALGPAAFAARARARLEAASR